LGETLGEHARRETRSRFLRHRFRAVPIFLSAFPVLAAQSVPGAILFFVCEKIFFRGLLYIKKKEKKIFVSTVLLAFGGLSHPKTHLPQHVTVRSNRIRSLLPRPLRKSIQTAGPHRPKATRPAV
jgi:hypothetical protein